LGDIVLTRAILVRAICFTISLLGILAPHRGLAEDGNQLPAKATKELPPQVLSLLEQRKMPKRSPILIRIFKEESELEVWKQDTTGRFELLRVYPICRWSGDLGPKISEGDRRAPEGFYTITPGLMNPNSNYYLAINTGFPNDYDRANDRHGAFLMIHGDCSSRGCYAMTDEQIGEIYSLARESFLGGQPSFQIQAYPFRMTPANLARHRTNPHMAFWKMLKIGNDHFEATHLEPKVDVCDKHYVFDAQQARSESKPLAFDPTGKCPVFVVNPKIARAALGKQHADELQYAQSVKANTPVAPIHSGLDGGMNRVFLAQVGGSIPPARMPSSGSQPSPPTDNNSSFASRLLGWFGWKSAPSTQVASAEATTLERGARSAATGSILAPKTKLASQAYAVASATPNELYISESANNAAAMPMPPQQEAASATLSMLPTEPVDSFESRWTGLQKAEASLAFNARWALDSESGEPGPWQRIPGAPSGALLAAGQPLMIDVGW
jgi:murein L,D-transpeptidase YafK